MQELEQKSVVADPSKLEIKDGNMRIRLDSRIANHVLNILRDLGLPQDSSGLKETPTRVARFLMDFCQPCDLVDLLKAFDYEDTTTQQGMPMVLVEQIPLAALCEHHLCPFFGTVDIG